MLSMMFKTSTKTQSSKNFFTQSRRLFSSVKEPKNGSNMMAYMLGGAGVAGMGFLAMKAGSL